MNHANIQFAQDFIDEAVFLSIKSLPVSDELVKAFHQEKEQIYGRRELSVQQRDRLFESFYKRSFKVLGLYEMFENIFNEFERLDHKEIFFFIRKVAGRKHEGAELFVRDGLKTVCVALQTGRIFNREYLRTFLRHELFHIADMLDPDFYYLPDIDCGGENELEDNLIRERFGVLWDISIDVRLRSRGFLTIVSEKERENIFSKAFRAWPEEQRTDVYRKVTQGRLRQSDLLLMSRKDHRSLTKADGALCPLCHFSSYEFIAGELEHNKDVVQSIIADYPAWGPAQGACRQCFEMYACRAH